MGVNSAHVLWLPITAMDRCHRGRAICAYAALSADIGDVAEI